MDSHKIENAEKRFWPKVKKTNNCWNWIACQSWQGYGYFGFRYKTIKAHRFSYELHNGKIPKGLFILHKCDNRLCVKPSHLFLGTQVDNIKDRVNKNRTSHGVNHYSAKLTEKKVKIIRGLSKDKKISSRKLGEMYNVSHSSILKIINHKTWKKIIL